MTGEHPIAPWVDLARTMPVAFAQVREDSLLDLALLEWIGGENLRCMMIASGGCTAAALVASGRLAELQLVDVNPAQIALTRFKLHLLQTAEPLDRARLLGHAPMEGRGHAMAETLQSLDLPPDVFGPPQIVAELGPDHAGRYELLFAHLRAEMGEFAAEWAEILNLSDVPVRIARVAPGTQLGRAMDDAFDQTMALDHLVRLFGVEATQNSVEPFSRHFARRTRHAIATLPTADNPYLWQLLVGRFPENVAYSWLNAPPRRRMPRVTEFMGAIDAAMRASRDPFDFVHLSNILDWLAADQGRRTLALASRALRPGGFVFIRQLNSTLVLPELSDAFEWLGEDAKTLHARDRSFFYRGLYLGRKR